MLEFGIVEFRVWLCVDVQDPAADVSWFAEARQDDSSLISRFEMVFHILFLECRSEERRVGKECRL